MEDGHWRSGNPHILCILQVLILIVMEDGHWLDKVEPKFKVGDWS